MHDPTYSWPGENVGNRQNIVFHYYSFPEKIFFICEAEQDTDLRQRVDKSKIKLTFLYI